MWMTKATVLLGLAAIAGACASGRVTSRPHPQVAAATQHEGKAGDGDGETNDEAKGGDGDGETNDDGPARGATQKHSDGESKD